MFKTIKDNKEGIAAVFIALLVLFSGLYYGQKYFPPLQHALTFLFYAAAITLVCYSPFFLIRAALPKTMHTFILEWFDVAWKVIGVPGDLYADKFANVYPKDAVAMNDKDTVRLVSTLRWQLCLTLALYAILLLTGAIVAIASFAQGVSITPIIEQATR